MLLYPKDRGIVDIVITCHNYAHYLDDAINSVINQDAMTNVIVIDDGSDNKEQVEHVVSKYSGISLFRTEFNSPLLARRHGYEQGCSDYIIFLDADDRLGEYYVSNALDIIGNNGIVYSDMQYFGNRDNKTDYSGTLDKSLISVTNFIHVGSMIKRDLIKIADAFTHPRITTDYHEDWYFWRKIISNTNCNIVKQSGVYHARIHDDNRSNAINRLSYYEMRGTCGDLITFCCIKPDSYNGKFINQQKWPLSQAHELLPKRSIKSKALSYDYAPLLHDYQIYNHIVKTATTDYIFFYNDTETYDAEVCKQLLCNMDHKYGIVHDARYNLMECTMIATMIIKNKFCVDLTQLKKEHIKYV